MRFFVLLAAILSAGRALRPSRPSRTPSPLPSPGGATTPLSRRAALALPVALAATATAVPLLPARAACICKTVTDCVCNDDAGANVNTVQRKRADAAGREAEQYRADMKAFRREDSLTSDESATSKGRQQKRITISEGASDGPTFLDRGSLTGFGTQNFNEVDVSAAKSRFRDILADTGTLVWRGSSARRAERRDC